MRLLQLAPIIKKILRNHHEKFDGTGYPDGLKEDKIPLEVRIITVVDSYDAMTSKRSYKESLSKEEAFAELKRCSGKQFDPVVADILIKIMS